MLTHLNISNFTLVDALDIELKPGLSALTGETGAGKSILLGALALTLGEKTDADKVRKGADKADVSASFDISTLGDAQKWLTEHELATEQDESDCMLRRVITKEGRSRAYINGKSVTLGQIREFGDQLIDMHSQHEHQSLLKPVNHIKLLDEYAGAQTISREVREHFRRWHHANEALQAALKINSDDDAREQLLSYQVSELDQLALEEGEIEKLEGEQAQLAGIDGAIQASHSTLTLINNDESGAREVTRQALVNARQLNDANSKVANIISLLEQAQIQLEEAESELEHYSSSLEHDPERLHFVESRLSAIYTLAKKHRVSPEQLNQLHQTLSQELNQLQSRDEHIASLEKALDRELTQFEEAASKLTLTRKTYSQTLAKCVNEKLAELAMSHASIKVALTTLEKPSAQGMENVEFLISTQPQQPHKPLHKIASGGELSRVSLAIQVVTAQTSAIPTLVFDEVDVGIGGATGDIVGRLLRELGERGQVLCVTHLPQVASKAHHHMRVEKQISEDAALSTLNELDENQRIDEIARMMGGSIGSEQSIAHAKEMLATL